MFAGCNPLNVIVITGIIFNLLGEAFQGADFDEVFSLEVLKPIEVCQRKYYFRIRLDPNNGCATLVSAVQVYSFTPARRRQFGVAVAIAAETPWERRD